METKELKVICPKEITEVGECLGEILRVAGQQLKDGWQTSSDVPPILAAAFSKLLVAIEGVQNIVTEFKTDPFSAELGLQIPVQLGAKDLFESLKKPDTV